MAKRGGTKCKLPMKKIAKKESLAPCHTKRTKGLFSKASKLCLLSPGSQIAVLATPSSSGSKVSFYSFGHSSADSVVSAFLSEKRPVPCPEDLGLGLGFWWEEERLQKSENPEELKEAMESISVLMKQLKDLELRNNENENENSNLKQNPLVDVESLASFDKTGGEEHDQILTICESFCDDGKTNCLNGGGNMEQEIEDRCELINFDEF